MKYVLSLFLLLLILSCNDTRQQNEKNILGNWVKVKNPTTANKNIVLEAPYFDKAGFSFYKNGTFENKTSYLRRTDSTTINLGGGSKYRINADSLYLLNPNSNKWEAHLLTKLTPDTLQFDLWDNKLATFKHYKPGSHKNPTFEKIVLSTSGCYGSCPIMSIILNDDGTILFKGLEYTGKKGMFEGKITKEKFQQLQANFSKADIASLKDRYNGSWSDDETISTTFIRKGRIYKTIDDYGRSAPFEFTWAYIPVRYLYQQLTLTKMSILPFISPRFNKIRGSSFRKGKNIAELTESEAFLLSDYLRNGKVTDTTFSQRFNLLIEYSDLPRDTITTDGRFFTFKIKDKSQTIDIGFNFYDVNAQQWKWRKIDDYD
ncbi:hypothetical protein DIU31_013885 [Mucilaginibacter rubeus]|uniref:DUF6438 domain-containing protein n=1 Tax=Mucilaginibacter rubeus TaxID=2027860 RepID=A0AAE6JGW9_9SPHI|nr:MULTISPECIES: DUF6438 domain-containing protein [Mucilaginibacter]QEM04547.1 hypothetical protein DIU31_013885 [Mucilaginibacter rubeus]QEM17141.1 hypothetical protein DIU38_014025 [Mucilaginibacter gossypii]QTE46353.1 hypothetical protein J3L19_13680 [Mucilaginibacter rubeus]QTE52950.1 hypothetical protein J3L21_13655 [Mucilaginibacter rubeus]QTE58036.1 hypothetical protein J3L23_05325 [Mucilaginibacter rubeus]